MITIHDSDNDNRDDDDRKKTHVQGALDQLFGRSGAAPVTRAVISLAHLWVFQEYVLLCFKN